MHQLFLLDDLLGIIFAEDTLSNRDLAVLARTCRAWYAPAVRCLWRSLPSPAPLLRLVPGVKIIDGVHTYGGDIDPLPDFSVLRAYAHFVRELDYRREVSLNSALSIIFLCAARQGGRTLLLPRLERLRISGATAGGDLIFPLAVAPKTSLKVVDADLGFKARSSDTCHTGLAMALSSACHLREIHIRGNLSSGLASPLCRPSLLANLRRVSLKTGTSLPARALLAILHAPNLEVLKVHAAHMDEADLTLGLSKGKPALSALRVLSLRATPPTASQILSLLPCGVESRLESLSLELDLEGHDLSSWAELLESLPATLNKLDIAAHAPDHAEVEVQQTPQPPPTYAVPSIPSTPHSTTVALPSTGQTTGVLGKTRPLPFASLLRLVDLQSITLDLPSFLAPVVTNADIVKMARSWSHLQVLDLGIGPALPSDQLTVKALETIAKEWPFLQKVSLPIPFPNGGMSVLPLPISSMSVLKKLSLRSPFPSKASQQFPWGLATMVEKTLEALRVLFPRLESLQGADNTEDVWTLVEEKLRRQSHAEGAVVEYA